MSAIEQLIEAANAEAARRRHLAQTARRMSISQIFEREAERWEALAAAAKLELAIIRPPNITGA